MLILAYLEDRLAGKTVTPPVEYLAKFVLDPAKVSADQIFKLETTLTFSRNSHLVAGELATDAGVASAATQLAPYTGPLTADPQKPLPKRSLTEFATNFAAAFAAPSGGGFRIATGADRDVFTGGGKSPLWVVQLGGDAAGQPISYTITDPGNPSIFAPRPISNVLKSKPDTPIIDYKTGSVISLDSTAVPKQFLSIDLDKWLGLTLGYIDDLLTPRYVSPAEILRKRLRVVMPGKEFPDALQNVLDAKEALAKGLRSLQGIPDYHPSSWLSFSAIDETSEDTKTKPPLHATLGQFVVPIVLREFPPTPNLVNQQELTVLTSACYQPMADAGHSGSPSDLLLGEVVCVRDGSYDPLGTAARWHYAFDYSMPLHPGQDEIHGVICSTSRRQGTRSRRTFPSAISSTTWLSSRKFYPAVLADLNIYLLPVDVNTADVTQLTNAQTALESAAVMIQWLADSAALPGPADQDVIAASADLSVRFRISEDSVAMKGVDAVKITIALDAALPPRTGTPYVESPTPGYHCERASGADQNKFAFFYKNADGNYLLASEAQKIPGRRFVLPDLDILERQDAQTEIYLTRNADLIPGKTIAEPFVYTTPQVSFENPLHPTLVNGDPVNLAAIFAAGENQPVRRTLQCQLSLLYEAVFANAGTDSVTLQVGLYYEYSINDALDRIRLPVYLMPPTSTAIREGGGGDKLADVIARQVQGWECWFKTYTPETKGGNLLFDLTVMSNLTQRPMPILRLTGLYLPFEYITPT